MTNATRKIEDIIKAPVIDATMEDVRKSWEGNGWTKLTDAMKEHSDVNVVRQFPTKPVFGKKGA